MKYDRPTRLRRCQLAIPGSSEKMMAKGSQIDVDYIFFDLEDAVAPSEKKASRSKVVEALNTLDFGRTTRSVRINDPASRYCYGDIIELVSGAGNNLDVIMVPKVLDAADVLFVDKLLSQLELDLGLDHKIGIECLIEDVEAMTNIDSIAASTPRLEALILGVGDFSASQGMPMESIEGTIDYPGDIWQYHRNRLVIACKTNGITPVDGPFVDFNKPDLYRIECRRAMQLGLLGKWAIHPSQIEHAQEIFSPSSNAVIAAREMKVAYDEALTQGIGAVQYKGKLIDAASIRMVQNIIDQADLIGM
jgi:citrate lyase subunit beta/citryl-CoA lyase